MNAVLDDRSLEAPMQRVLQDVERIDFSNVIDKLTGPEDQRGCGWTLERAMDALKWYKRMLATYKVFRHNTNPLTDDIDEVWHSHILHTREYAEDCQKLFGEFLHHCPCGPNAPAELKERLKESAEIQIERFKTFFGESPIGFVGCGENFPCMCSR